MTQDSTGAIILPPVAIATGSPAGDALENINTFLIGDGSLCYVSSGTGKGMWQLEKDSVEAAGATVVAPIAGPGRWYLKFVSSQVANESTVTGDSVTEALDALKAAGGFTPLPGMTLRDVRSYAPSTTAALTQGTQYELKVTPEVPASATAPFMRPQLSAVNNAYAYEVELELPIKWSASAAEVAQSLVSLQVSPDAGTTWYTLDGDGTIQSEAFDVGDVGQNWISLRTSRIPGTSITGFTNGGTLTARALFHHTVGSNTAISLNGYGLLPQMQCTLREIQRF